MYALVSLHTFLDSNPSSDAVVLSNNQLVCQLVERYASAKGVGGRVKPVCLPCEQFSVASKAKFLTKNTHIAIKVAGTEYMRGQEHYNCDADTVFINSMVHGTGDATFFAPPKPKSVFITDDNHEKVFSSLSITRKIDHAFIASVPWVNQGIFHVRDTSKVLTILGELVHCFHDGAPSVFINCVPDEIVFNALAWNLGMSSITQDDMGMNIFPTWAFEARKPIRSIHFAYTQRPSNIMFLKEMTNKGIKWHPEKTLAGFKGSELTAVFTDAIRDYDTMFNLVRLGEASEHTKRMFGWMSSSFIWYGELWKVNDALDNWFDLPFRESASSQMTKDIIAWMSKAN